MKDRFTLLNIMLIVFLSGVHAAPAQTKSPTHKEVRAVWTHFDQVVEPDSEQGKQSILFAGEGYSHGGGTGISTSRARILYDGLSDPSR